MCDPVTISMIAVGGQLAASGLSAYGQHEQGKYQQDMANYQRNMEIQRAAEARDAAGQAVLERSEQRRQQLGVARAAAAAGGAMLDASPLDAVNMWEQDQAYLGAYETSKIKRDAELAEWGFLSSADMLGSQGSMAHWSGNLGAVGTMIGGSGQAVGYAGQGYSGYQQNQRISALENGGGYDYSSVAN